ncbi:MAG: hypothetical protein ACR2PH_09810, partial [Desulfobulbia bacterium]
SVEGVRNRSSLLSLAIVAPFRQLFLLNQTIKLNLCIYRYIDLKYNERTDMQHSTNYFVVSKPMIG